MGGLNLVDTVWSPNTVKGGYRKGNGGEGLGGGGNQEDTAWSPNTWGEGENTGNGEEGRGGGGGGSFGLAENRGI